MNFLLIFVVLFLAWSNGANDNFKGVATLYGSGTTGFGEARLWATSATVAGSLVSVALAGVLAKTFSGSGLVAESFLDQRFLVSIGLAAATTIALATRLGMPTSTTHALTGALVGTGLMAAGVTGIAWNLLLTKFAQPLLLSPILAITLTLIVYPLASRTRRKLGLESDSCVCIGGERPHPAPDGTVAMASLPQPPTLIRGKTADCRERYVGRVVGVAAQRVVDIVHHLSAGAVCFARAVNDTPKVAALLLAAGAVSGTRSAAPTLAVVALFMAAGGWLQSRRVAETMSREITDLNTGQGLTANLVTATLVLGASRMGVPVSTTHVSCGSIFGIGWARRDGRWSTVARILTTWVTTLPLGALLGALSYVVLGYLLGA